MVSVNRFCRPVGHGPAHASIVSHGSSGIKFRFFLVGSNDPEPLRCPSGRCQARQATRITDDRIDKVLDLFEHDWSDDEQYFKYVAASSSFEHDATALSELEVRKVSCARTTAAEVGITAARLIDSEVAEDGQTSAANQALQLAEVSTTARTSGPSRLRRRPAWCHQIDGATAA